MCQFVNKSAGSNNFGEDSATTSQAVNMEDNTYQYVVQVSDVSASYATYTVEGDEVLYKAPLSNADDYNSPVTHEFYIIPTKRVRIEIEYLDNNDVINLSGFGIYLGIGDLVLTQQGNSPMIVHLPDEQYIQLDNIITTNIDSSNFIFSDTYTSPSYAPTAIKQKITSSTAGIQIVPMTGLSLVAIAVAISVAATLCGWLLAFAYLYRMRAARKKVSSLTSILPVIEQRSSSDYGNSEKTELVGSSHHTINCVSNRFVDNAAPIAPSGTSHYLLSAEVNAVDEHGRSNAAHCDETASSALHSIEAHTNANVTATSGYQNHFSNFNFHIDAQHMYATRVDETGDSALQRSPSQYSMHSSNPDSIVFADEQEGSVYSDSEHGDAAV